MATLYVVSTPIGNLEDITLRALRILKEVSYILCEDTRVTKKLLTKYAISTKTLSYHTHSGFSKTEQIIEMLLNGESLALVTDAGTPGVSDPGSLLVALVREKCMTELKDGSIKIESVPGPSALTAAISISGIPLNRFTFLGFLPHKKGRESLFTEMSSDDGEYIFYESSHRISKTLEALSSHLIGKDKMVTVCREISKFFEEVVSGDADTVKKHFENNPDKVRGEFAVIVSICRHKL